MGLRATRLARIRLETGLEPIVRIRCDLRGGSRGDLATNSLPIGKLTDLVENLTITEN